MVLAVMLGITGFVLHVGFIMFDYGFHNPDSGAFIKLRNVANETISNETWRNDANSQGNMLRQAFGIGRVICIGLCVLCFIIAVLDRPSAGGR